MFKSMCFIGGGRITYLLLKRLQQVNARYEHITVCEPDEHAGKKIHGLNLSNLRLLTDPPAGETYDLVFLAVHPPVVKNVIKDVRNSLDPTSILVSFVPVIKTSALREMSGGHERLVRMIPNASSIIGEGYNPVCFTENVPSEVRSELDRLFLHWGRAPEVNEEKLEAYAILTAMGPTYFWFQWLELMRLGKEFNLEESELREGMHEMLSGASKLMFKSDYTVDEIRDLIPVKPLQDHEEDFRMAINTKLSLLYSKLTPANK